MKHPIGFSRLGLVVLCMGLISGCVWIRAPEPRPENLSVRPAGVVRRVNAAERYVVFESTFPFEPGQELRAMREGRPVATLRVHPLRQRPFYAADILEGAPREEDLVE